MTKEAAIYNGKKTVSNNWCWENWTARCKRIKLEYSLTPYTKINSKRILDLNVRLNTAKLLKENRKNTNINRSNIFSDLPPKVMKIKTKINKWDLIKLKSFFTAKETMKKMKRQPSNGRKHSQTKQTKY